jgi:hypothetical protein
MSFLLSFRSQNVQQCRLVVAYTRNEAAAVESDEDKAGIISRNSLSASAAWRGIQLRMRVFIKLI